MYCLRFIKKLLASHNNSLLKPSLMRGVCHKFVTIAVGNRSLIDSGLSQSAAAQFLFTPSRKLGVVTKLTNAFHCAITTRSYLTVLLIFTVHIRTTWECHTPILGRADQIASILHKIQTLSIFYYVHT